MKRFYKDAGVDETPGGFRVLLDGKPVKTPARNTLLLPTRALGEAIAEEWQAQGDEIVPAAMPMLRLANTVLDGIVHTRDDVISAILRFGEHDLICYRTEAPADLAARQAAAWTPMLTWLQSRHNATLQTGSGVGHIAQSSQTLAALRAAIAAQDDFALASLHVMASITGSLVLALALADRQVNAAQAFQLSRLDEDYQAEKWGRDAEAETRSRALAREMDAAMAFLTVSRA